MKVNRLSLGLQEQLKEASNFNTARSETLFDKKKLGVNDNEEVNFSNLEVDDLNITEDQISNLLGSFTDEIINIFNGKIPEALNDNPLKEQNPNNPSQNPVFTA